MIRKWKAILEMIRFSHTLFALPFALLSAALAWYGKRSFQFVELCGILLCMVFARSTAMAFNRLADRKIDAQNPRTALRHLPAGQLSVFAVAIFAALCAAGFIASTALFLLAVPSNTSPILLSIPVLIFICAYSFTKRFTMFAHVWLGASLLLAPLAAWIAIRGFVELSVPLVLGSAVLIWVSGFDVIYACQDADFDRAAKLRSIPAVMGVTNALRVALACHVIMIGFLVALYFVASPPLGGSYLTGVALATALILYEHALVSPKNLTKVNQAFFHVNAVISVGLLVAALLDVLLAR